MMDNICFGLRPPVFTGHCLVPGTMTAALSNHLINPQSIPPGGSHNVGKGLFIINQATAKVYSENGFQKLFWRILIYETTRQSAEERNPTYLNISRQLKVSGIILVMYEDMDRLTVTPIHTLSLPFAALLNFFLVGELSVFYLSCFK